MKYQILVWSLIVGDYRPSHWQKFNCRYEAEKFAHKTIKHSKWIVEAV